MPVPRRVEVALDTEREIRYNVLMTTTPDTVRYRFQVDNSPIANDPHYVRVTGPIPVDDTNHWFLDMLRISRLTPTFPVGAELVLTIPAADGEPPYVRTWTILPPEDES